MTNMLKYNRGENMLNIRKEIEASFNDMIKDLETLVSYNSVLDLDTANVNQPFGKANKEVLDEMLAIGKRDGFVTKNIDGYAGHIDIGSGEDVIAILGHLDIVPVNESGWETNPFKLTLKDGKYYGRGTSDDKGPLLYGYYAAKILNQLGLIKDKTIRIIFGCNEETGSQCMKYYFSKEPYPNMGFTPDANFPVVYGEKKGVGVTFKGNCATQDLISLNAGTVVNIVPEKATAVLSKPKSFFEDTFTSFIKQKGVEGKLIEENGITTIELIGKSSHASLPHLGINAVVVLSEYLSTMIDHPVVQFINQYFKGDYEAKRLGFGFEGQMGVLTCNVGIVHFNEGQLEIKLDIRSPHELDEKYMVECLDKVSKEYSFAFDYNVGAHLFVDSNSKLIQSLHKAYIECSGDVEALPQAIGGGTYAKTMPNCVAFGPEFPGTDNQIHQNNEFMDIEEAKKAIEIYANALFNLMK